MKIVINEPKDKISFENKVAYLKALLIQEYISGLDVSKEIKNKIRSEVIKKLENMDKKN